MLPVRIVRIRETRVPEPDFEAIRLVSNMSDWVPANNPPEGKLIQSSGWLLILFKV